MSALLLYILQNLKDYKRSYSAIFLGMVIGVYFYTTIPQYIVTASELKAVEKSLEQKINTVDENASWRNLRTEKSLLGLEEWNYKTKIEDLKSKGLPIQRELQEAYNDTKDRLKEVKEELKILKDKIKNRDR